MRPRLSVCVIKEPSDSCENIAHKGTARHKVNWPDRRQFDDTIAKVSISPGGANELVQIVTQAFVC